MKTRIRIAFALACALLLCGGLVGCGCSSNQTQDDATPATEQKQETEDTQKTEGATEQKQDENTNAKAEDALPTGEVTTVTLTNETGYDVTTIALRASGSASYAEDHTFGDLAAANGSAFEVSFAQYLAEGAPVQNYDILLTTVDGGYIELFGVNLQSPDEIVLRYENGVGYVEYRNGDEVVSTQEESEQNMLENTSDVETYDMQNQLG